MSYSSKSGIYLIELFNHNEMFNKIGTSKNKYSRFNQIVKSGYDCKILSFIRGIDMIEAMELETLYRELYHDKTYQPNIKFPGYTECYYDIDINSFDDIATWYPNKYDVIIKNIFIYGS